MKTNLTIEAVEKKTSKNGRDYHSFRTSQGTMSCFEKAEVDKLIASIGHAADVDVEERNGFKNITKFHTQTPDAAPREERVTNAPPNTAWEDARKAKDASMLTSYAKDVYITLTSRAHATSEDALMRLSISLIKTAHESFLHDEEEKKEVEHANGQHE